MDGRIESTKHGVTLTINKASTDEDRVRALEARLGRCLPDDYREFLLRHNGGRPEPRLFRIPKRGGAYTNSTVDWFLSLHDGQNSNLEKDLHTLRDRIPPDTLPIADDPFGNVILIGLHDHQRGKIYFWDHEEEPESQPDWSNVVQIADSFDQFMRELRAT